MTLFDKSDISVYIHIPFCGKIRKGERSLVLPSTRETRNAYLDALERELMSAGDILEGRRIASICVGGGIATVVSPDRLARILLKFKRTYQIVSGAELSVTAAPQTLVTPCLSGLNMCNVNRISIHALTPVDSLLTEINAGHTMIDIENGTSLVMKFGHSNVDVVLLYGIPGQTLTTIKNAIIAFTSVRGLKHITLKRYELWKESGVSAEDCKAQYTQAVEILAVREMIQYSAECFSHGGWISKFLLHELNGMERLGFGLGARSYVDNMIYQNTTDLGTFLDSSGDFSKIINTASELSDLDRMKRFVALRLQLVEGFTYDEYKYIFGHTPERAILEKIDTLTAGGFVTCKNGQVRPTAMGLMLSSEVQTTVVGG